MKELNNEAYLRKLEGQGVKVNALRQSMEDKNKAMAGSKTVEK